MTPEHPTAKQQPDLSAEDIDVLSGCFEGWQKIAASKGVSPPSPLAFRLFSLDHESGTLLDDLTDIIESDPILTARILGIANSSAFAVAGKTLFNVHRAVMRLGTDLACEISEAQMLGAWFRSPEGAIEPAILRGLWQEYLMTGFCAREIALALEDDDVDPMQVYAAGLLHDVGTLALCRAEPQAMARFIRAGYAAGTPLHERFLAAHSRIGAALLQQWRAPNELVLVAQRHHLGLDPGEIASTFVVSIADHLHAAIFEVEGTALKPAGDFPLGCAIPDNETIADALEALGLGDQLDDIVRRVAAASRRLELLADIA